MWKFRIPGFLAVLAIALNVATSLRAGPTLGDAPRAPADLSGLPGGGPQPKGVTGGFTVDTGSREQVRSFYNSVYISSDGVSMDTTAIISTSTAGTNSFAFQQAVLRRINWFRALAGVPAAITLDAAESAQNQAAALMMSANTN